MKKITYIKPRIITALTLGFGVLVFIIFIAQQRLGVHAQTANTWPQVQGDAHHSGYVPQTVVPPYTELWRTRRLISSRVQPIIGPNHAYLPANDNKLYAINLNDGSEAWSFNTDGANVNSAGYENGTVFFGSTDHYIYALNANDGSLKWKFLTNSSVKTAPLLADGKVFMGSSDGNMYALNQANGSLVWQYDIGAPIYDTAAYDNGKIFFGGLNSKGYALNATSGQLIWSYQLNGQGLRDRWTVAGNGRVIFTPVLDRTHHTSLNDGTVIFRADQGDLYAQPWSVQRQAILDLLAEKPYEQSMFILDQSTGQPAFTPPILYASGGSHSPHSQVVLLPNGNADVIYRRTFGNPAQWGATTKNALVSGQLNLQTGDITPYDQCDGWGSSTCSFASPFTSDESATLVRSGDVLYLDIARGTIGMDIPNQVRLPILALYNPTSGGPFGSGATVKFDDYHGLPDAGWRIDQDNIYAEADSDGNDLKRPTPIVGNIFYILHYGDLVAVRGTLR